MNARLAVCAALCAGVASAACHHAPAMRVDRDPATDARVPASVDVTGVWIVDGSPPPSAADSGWAQDHSHCVAQWGAYYQLFQEPSGVVRLHWTRGGFVTGTPPGRCPRDAAAPGVLDAETAEGAVGGARIALDGTATFARDGDGGDCPTGDEERVAYDLRYDADNQGGALAGTRNGAPIRLVRSDAPTICTDIP